MARICDRGGIVETNYVRNSVDKWVRCGELFRLASQGLNLTALRLEWKAPDFVGSRSIWTPLQACKVLELVRRKPYSTRAFVDEAGGMGPGSSSESRTR
jgi:hypothetical protein